MKLLSGLAIVAYAQSGDGSSDVAVDAPSMEAASAPAFRQRAISSGGNSDYEYYYEQSALGRRKKKKKKKIIFNIPQARPTTTRAPATTTRAPLPAISNDYNQLFGANGSFGSKVSADYLDYNGGSAGVAGSASDRWSGFGDNSYAYDYSDGFGEITVGNTYGGKGQFELNYISDGATHTNGLTASAGSQFFNGSNNDLGEWNPADENGAGAHRWDNDDINKYWEYMHRQWGHQQENRLGRNFAYDPALTSADALEEPSRWYHVAPERVINNLNRGYLNYQFPSTDGKGQPNLPHFKFPVDRRAFLQAGRHGHPWGIVPDKEWDLRVDIRDGGTGTGEGGDGTPGDGGFGRTKFGWYAQPWLWDAENVPGVSDYKLWNGVNYGKFAQVGEGNTGQDSNSHTSLQHTFGFIDWKDANKDSFANDDETGIIPGTAGSDSTEAQGIRFQDVSPARAPWYGRRFDASWELGDSPAHFVFDGVMAHGGRTPFDTTFSEENKTVGYFDRTGASENQTEQVGWQRYYSGYRWFPGVANFPGTQYTPDNGTSVATNTPGWSNYTPNMHGEGALPENTNQVNDPAKLKCHQCIESAHLEWDDKYHTFKLVSSHSIGTTHYIARDNLDDGDFGYASTSDAIDHANNTNAHTKNVDLWKQCFDTIKQKSCEYSSGVCFVEERRVWGYVTQVQAGCQQAQACYMQKYQNFVVEAGRQCWPGDAFGEKHKLATRPDDMRADQWIYNIIKGGLLLAQKDRPDWDPNDHRYRKFASHYFTEMENDDVAQLSSLVRAPTANNARMTLQPGQAYNGATYDFRESNNWVDKFNSGFTGDLDDDLSGGTHQISRATLTDGNFGVGRSGYESAFSTLLHYPTFMNSGGRGDKFNNYIYRGGFTSTDGTKDTTSPYVPADIATSNQVYGMKIGDELYDTLDKANKGQTTTHLGGDDGEVITALGQTDSQIGTVKDLDYNGQGGADGSMFSERSQFYQNEGSRFTPSIRTGGALPDGTIRTIDDQWRNPDQHNYVIQAGAGDAGDAIDTEIFRQSINADSTARWNTGALSTSLDNIIEGKTEWTESSRYQPIEYKNGLVEASKCHQCCNTDHNCNWNWQPTTKLDWNFAYVWRYQAIDERSNPTGWNEDADPAASIATEESMGEGNNNRNWAAGITTLSQTIQDHHFNFPPYMANHHENRGGTVSSLGQPVGSKAVMSKNDQTYTFNPQGAAPVYSGYSSISPDPSG